MAMVRSFIPMLLQIQIEGVRLEPFGVVALSEIS